MRGDDASKGSLFSYLDLEKRVSADHPLRVIREIANAALKVLSRDFDTLYSPIRRESIPPERLLRALLLQAFYLIRSERQLVERIDDDLLFRWFVGWALRIQYGTPPPSPRTATGCWTARWQPSFSPRCCRTIRSRVFCRAITSR